MTERGKIPRLRALEAEQARLGLEIQRVKTWMFGLLLTVAGLVGVVIALWLIHAASLLHAADFIQAVTP